MTISPPKATCRVFTFKEGLLSRIAHDLEIDVERFEVEIDEDDVTASFEASSMRVLHAMKNGRPAPGTLSTGDRRKIEETIQTDVLQTSKHRAIRFSGTSKRSDDEVTVDGKLLLHGAERPVRVVFRPEGGQLVGSVSLDQREFGITPYTAMMNTLRIQPVVRVELRLPRW